MSSTELLLALTFRPCSCKLCKDVVFQHKVVIGILKCDACIFFSHNSQAQKEGSSVKGSWRYSFRTLALHTTWLFASELFILKAAYPLSLPTFFGPTTLCQLNIPAKHFGVSWAFFNTSFCNIVGVKCQISTTKNILGTWRSTDKILLFLVRHV